MSSAVILLFPTLSLQVKKHLYHFLVVKNLQAIRLILSHKIYIIYMAHVEFDRRIAFLLIKDFFGRESETFYSRIVSAKSDLTAGYIDSKTP